MGSLVYGQAMTIEFEDRVLAHLQLAIGTKLRRNERFFLSWRTADADGGGRTTLWINPSIPLVFRYSAPAMPSINRQWLEQLVESANSAQGLTLSDEPVPPADQVPSRVLVGAGASPRAYRQR